MEEEIKILPSSIFTDQSLNTIEVFGVDLNNVALELPKGKMGHY